MQLSQLAGIHAHWTAAVEAASIDETGPRIGEVAVNTHPANLHLTCESPLFRSELKIVPKTALALQAHDVEQEQSTAVLPPVTGAVGGAPGLGSGPFARPGWVFKPSAHCDTQCLSGCVSDRAWSGADVCCS